MPRLRSFRTSDVEAIDRIWRKHHSNDFSVPDRRNAVVDAVVEDDNGEVIAYGQVRLFAEAMFILDLDARARDKIEALKLLMLEAFRGTDSAGLRNLYAFISDPEFADLIEKHFGFERADKVGELLLREI
jgi:hypothetical protein